MRYFTPWVYLDMVAYAWAPGLRACGYDLAMACSERRPASGVFGEGDAARRRAAIEALYVFLDSSPS